MNSAALRSRTTKHGGEDGDDTAGPAPVLDTDAQEALVLELERDARRQATIWRRVFGALSIAWGVYFLDCAARAAELQAWYAKADAVLPPAYEPANKEAVDAGCRQARRHVARTFQRRDAAAAS